MSFDDLVDAGSMAEAKARGKVRIEGKDYVMPTATSWSSASTCDQAQTRAARYPADSACAAVAKHTSALVTS